MHRQAELVSAVTDLISLGLGKDGVAGQAQRVLQPDQPSLRAVIKRRRNLFLDLRPSQGAVFTGNRSRQTTGERSHRGRFQVDEVRALFADDLLPVMGVAFHRYLVAHGSAGDEDGGFALEDLRRTLLHAIDRWIFAADLIT